MNDSDEFDPLADPGSREALALQKARARKTSGRFFALAVSDAEATERAAVEQALSASRAAYDGASDLEAALKPLSAQREANFGPPERARRGRLRRAEDDDLAWAIALSSDAAPQQGDADLGGDRPLRGGRRGGRRLPPRAGARGVDRGHVTRPHPSPCKPVSRLNLRLAIAPAGGGNLRLAIAPAGGGRGSGTCVSCTTHRVSMGQDDEFGRGFTSVHATS